MPLIDILTLQVGAAISKGILKHWLKDSTFLADASANLVDVLKIVTTDVIAQQKGRRQFEEIGESVAQSLMPLFQSEGASLTENGQDAVALAVAETLDKAQIDPKLLAQQNLEPTILTRHLIDGRPEATRDFSEAETEFYRRIISECSQYIVDIASRLPSFTERTFAEVLKRESQIVQIATQTLEEVRRLRGDDPANFETQYRRAVIRGLDNMELFGVDVSRPSRRHSLSVAYITLSVERQTTRWQKEPSRGADIHGSHDVVLPVDAALSGPRCLLLRGDAGSGKTTLLKWVAVRCAARDFEGPLSSWNNTIPFFIRLRQFVDKPLPTPADFPALVAPAIMETAPRGWVTEQLNSDRALVLVDGVDEIPKVQRGQVRDWLDNLVGSFEGARFLVTSRPGAVEEGWLASEGFDDAKFQSMELTDIDDFIEHWHNAVYEELQDEAEKAEMDALAENLKTVIRGNRSIRNLSTNPLLGSMLCALHRDRNRQLPADRIELYEACCRMLLERRERERGIQLSDYPELTYRHKQALLQDLAYWFQRNNDSIVALKEAEKRLSRKMTGMRNFPPDTTATQIARFFIDRSGIVREPIAGQMDFTHRTFQEFFAAKEAVDERDFGLLVTNAHDDQWQEVIILAAGLASKADREELLKDLIARGDSEEERLHQLHLLAVSCLETQVELSPEVEKEVQQRLDKLVPPRDTDHAETLATAGELAVPYLVHRAEYEADVAAACAHGLIRIGSPFALETLTGYVTDDRRAVIDELENAIDFLEPKDYAEYVLGPKSQASGRLKISDDRLLEYVLDFADHLTQLDLRALSVSEIDVLARLTNLSHLYLGSTQVSDISPLVNLAQLSELDLSATPVDDIRPLAKLPRLTRLNLGASGVRNLKPLVNLTHLTELDLYGTQVDDIRPLAELTRLTRLNLSLSRVTDLSPLTGLAHLAELNLRWTQIDEADIPEKLKNVEILIPPSELVERDGKIFNGKDGAEMALIPAGDFEMGDHAGEGDENEGPVHAVAVDPFYMDVHPVTNAQYRKFVEATGHDEPYYWGEERFNGADQPVVSVSWYDAMAYCQWAGKRLPTEAEWEKAARGGLVGKRFPWGDDDPDESKACYDQDWTEGKPSPVRGYLPNGYGLYDMAGNAWEWCLDEYQEDFYARSPEENPFADSEYGATLNVIYNFTNVKNWRVLRGGSWVNGPDVLRCAARAGFRPGLWYLYVGFRCASPRLPCPGWSDALRSRTFRPYPREQGKQIDSRLGHPAE